MLEVIDRALAHHVGNSEVDEHDGSVRALCEFFMPHEGLVHTGEYADRSIQTERGWRIALRMIKERSYFDADYHRWTLLETDW